MGGERGGSWNKRITFSPPNFPSQNKGGVRNKVLDLSTKFSCFCKGSHAQACLYHFYHHCYCRVFFPSALKIQPQANKEQRSNMLRKNSKKGLYQSKQFRTMLGSQGCIPIKQGMISLPLNSVGSWKSFLMNDSESRNSLILW